MTIKSHFAHYRARPKICFYWLSSQQFWLHISLSLFLRTMEPISVPYVFKTTLTQQMCREKRLKLPIFKGILVSQKCLTVLRGYLCSQGSLYPQSFVMVLTPTHHRFDSWGMEPLACEKSRVVGGKYISEHQAKFDSSKHQAHVWYVFLYFSRKRWSHRFLKRLWLVQLT